MLLLKFKFKNKNRDSMTLNLILFCCREFTLARDVMKAHYAGLRDVIIYGVKEVEGHTVL